MKKEEEEKKKDNRKGSLETPDDKREKKEKQEWQKKAETKGIDTKKWRKNTKRSQAPDRMFHKFTPTKAVHPRFWNS